MTTAVWIVYGILLGYFLAMNLTHAGFLLASLRQNRTRSREVRHTDLHRLAASAVTIPVSVIVPAFNEEAVILESVLSILRSAHPEFEVIVVNDGSTDQTLDVLREQFGLDRRDIFRPTPIVTQPVRSVYCSREVPNLLVIDKDNGGEADAVNSGVNYSSYRYVLHTDADCVFEPDTLLRTIRVVSFDPRRVIALAGQLRPANGLVMQHGSIVERGLPSRLVERFQVVEYLSAFLTHRLAWSAFNASPVMAGGFSAWRRDVVLDLGGYATDLTHEDIELTVHAHEHFRRKRIPYRLLTIPDAVIWTQVPPTWRDLFMQRKRWQRVVFEVIWKYRRMLFNPRYGAVGVVTMPYLFLYEALGPFVEAFAYLFTGALAVLGILGVNALLLFLALSWAVTAVSRLTSLLLDVVFFDVYRPADVARLAILSVLEPIVYRPLLLPVRMYAFLEFVRGHKTHETLSRSAVGTHVSEA
jgi:cellulose synthase/poly-beta-1,6-N-acetylglucosamine synthase-like glycosyltransferase